jgi:hypothetical protein
LSYPNFYSQANEELTKAAHSFLSLTQQNIREAIPGAVYSLVVLKLTTTLDIGIFIITQKVDIPDSHGSAISVHTYKVLIKNSTEFTQDLSNVDVFATE